MTDNAEYLRQLRIIAKAKGLCVQCRARPRTQATTACEVCRARGKERKARNKAAGLCSCGNRPRKGKKLCVSCAASNRRTAAKRYEALRSARICTRCRKAPTDRVAITCEACRLWASEYKRKRYVKLKLEARP